MKILGDKIQAALAHRVMGHLFIPLSRQQLHPTPPYPHPHQPGTARLSASHRLPPQALRGQTLLLVPPPRGQTETFSGSHSLALSLVTLRLCWGARWQKRESHALGHLCCFRHIPGNQSSAERTNGRGGGGGRRQEAEVPLPRLSLLRNWNGSFPRERQHFGWSGSFHNEQNPCNRLHNFPITSRLREARDPANPPTGRLLFSSGAKHLFLPPDRHSRKRCSEANKEVLPISFPRCCGRVSELTDCSSLVEMACALKLGLRNSEQADVA